LKLLKSGLIKGLTVIARSSLSELNSRGNCSDLFKGFKGINNSRINKRDVYFNNFNRINSFNILKFYYKERMVL
jgi:PPE-repeat protein